MTSWRGERWHQFLILSISWSVVFGFIEQSAAVWRHLSISWLSVLVFEAERRARHNGDTACRSADRWVTSLPIDQLIGRPSLWGREKSEATWRHCCLSISWSVSDVIIIDQLIDRPSPWSRVRGVRGNDRAPPRSISWSVRDVTSYRSAEWSSWSLKQSASRARQWSRASLNSSFPSGGASALLL